MDIIKRLDNLRREFPACSLAAFADLSAGTILGASADTPVAQERLDRLCVTAAEMLAGESAQRIAETLGPKGAIRFSYAIAIEQSELSLFLTSETELDDTLCCVCASGVDFEAFFQAAQMNLSEISAGG